MLQIKKTVTNNGKEVEKLKPSDIAGGNIKWKIQLFQKIFWQFLKKLSINLSFDSIPRYLPNKCPHKTCTQMFIATLFIIAPNWKQFKYPPTGELIQKLWYIHATEYCSPIKRNKLLIFAMTWMNFKNIMLSERSLKNNSIVQSHYMKCPNKANS